jgi:hypothetical protein
MARMSFDFCNHQLEPKMNREQAFQDFFNSDLALETRAFPFRYDRWDQIFFIKLFIVENEIRIDYFLAFIGCKNIQFREKTLQTRLFKFRQIHNHSLVESQSEGLRLEFCSAELWTHEYFHEYDRAIYEKLGDEGRYGTSKVITSLSEI